MGQFRTVWYKILCYNGRVKADGFGLSFVYELFTHSTGFLLDAEQSVLHGMLGTPRRKSLLPCPAQIAPESCRTMSHDVAQCRTMSQDAQVNMCYNVNCQRRTRTQDAAQQQRKPSMGSSSSCRPLTKHRFTSNLVVAYDGILTLQYWESSVPWHESSP